MKSAKDWVEDYSSLPPCLLANFGDCECAPSKDGCDVLENLFTAIQRDARAAGIREAAAQCEREKTDRTGAYHEGGNDALKAASAAILALIEKENG